MSNRLNYSNVKTFGLISAEGLSITGEYSFPLQDGLANQVLSTDGLGNVQFTDLSALQIITATNILNGTGINWTIIGLNTVQGDVTLSPFSTTDLSEGINLYFTNERVDDRVAALLRRGLIGSSPTTPLTWVYDDVANTLSPQISISAFTTDNLPQGTTNLYFSGELVDDRVASLLKSGIKGASGTNTIVWNYVDGLDSLTPAVSLGPFNSDDLAEGITNLYFTDDRAIDAVGGSLVNSATVTWTYNALLNTIEATAITGISDIEIQQDGFTIANRPIIDFVTGTNILLNVSDDALNNKVSVEINANIGGALDDLSDVFFLSPGPQTNDVLYFNGAAWTTTDVFSILPADYESISYADLRSTALSSNLVTGRKYLINDYQTIYNIPGTSPQVEATGAIEPLIVTAISNSEISPIAFSPSNPNDIIHYNLSSWAVGFRNSTINSKGVIYYREDTINRNIYPADFREIICRRWDDGSGNYEVTTDNSNPYTDYPIFGANCFDNRIDPTDLTIIQGSYSIAEALPNIYLRANSLENYFSPSCYGISFTTSNTALCKFNGITINSSFRGATTQIINNGVILNSIFKAGVASTIINSEETITGISSSTFDSTVSNCELAAISNSIFSDILTNSNIAYINNSSFTGAVSYCKINAISGVTATGLFGFIEGITIEDCTFSDDVDNLYFNKLKNITFNGTVKNNNLYTFINGTTKTVGLSFHQNTFLKAISDTTIGDNMTACFFAGEVTDSIFEDDITYCNFLGDLNSCEFKAPSMTKVTFQGALNTFKIFNTCTALSSVTFITGVFNATSLGTGSTNLADSTKFTEVIVDSLGGSGNLYERYIDLIGSPPVPEYVYTLLV